MLLHLFLWLFFPVNNFLRYKHTKRVWAKFREITLLRVNTGWKENKVNSTRGLKQGKIKGSTEWNKKMLKRFNRGKELNKHTGIKSKKQDKRVVKFMDFGAQRLVYGKMPKLPLISCVILALVFPYLNWEYNTISSQGSSKKQYNVCILSA